MSEEKEGYLPIVNIWDNKNNLYSYKEDIEETYFKTYHLGIARELKAMTFPTQFIFNLGMDKQRPLFVEVVSIGVVNISTKDKTKGFSLSQGDVSFFKIMEEKDSNFIKLELLSQLNCFMNKML